MRPHINALLNKYCEDVIISKFIANCWQREAEAYCADIDFDNLQRGATYVPFECAVEMQKGLKSREIKVIWDDRGENLPETINYCKKKWLSILFLLQKYDRYGIDFPELLTMHSTSSDEDTSLLWIVSTLLTRIQSI